jgi:lauroyl/myristoyl acyltransferase
LQLCSVDEKAFWLGVHSRSAQSCNAPVIFYTDESPRGALRWLQQKGRTLTVALDVREPGYPKIEYPFDFMGQTIFLQTGAVKLALKAGAQLLPAAIEFDPLNKVHHMVIYPQVEFKSDYLMTQSALKCLERHLARTPEQAFYEIVQTLKTPQDPNFLQARP